MATRNLARADENQTALITWSGLLNGDDGSPYTPFDFADMSVAITGTFGAGGTIVIEGSNDNANWFTLNDLQGSAISKTAAAFEGVAEIAKFVRPRVTAGDGTTNLVATLYARRAR